ncbi:MAG TPA: flagellar hook-basal body complex protein [Devosia sp.]|nr:flagellar hook-basal body complex protein [Devosia sp.]
MGIYGALSTAVTGLRAQSFSLENISGNIANSQTTGFKRIDTDFLDLIPDAPTKLQTSGSVLAQSRATNTLQGDIKSVSNTTYMAINGAGFFVVEPAIGQADGAATFGGANYYTRRGDFDVDKSGYLVNGSGYYLKGLPIDPVTQNISGSVPQVLRISNSFLPASQTTRVNYQLNLPQLPKTADYTASKTPGSELLKPQDFGFANYNIAAVREGATATGTDPASSLAGPTESLTIKIGDNPEVVIDFVNDGSGTTGNTIDTTDTDTDDVTEVLDYISSLLPGGATVSLVGGKITITAGNFDDSVTVADATTGMGFTNGTTEPSITLSAQLAARATTIAAEDSDAFIAQSLSGGAITVYAQNGAPANVQLRWAKIASTETGGVERWNLFYLSNSSATGSDPMWTNVNVDYEFGADGGLSPAINQTDLTGLTVNGVTVGNVALVHGTGGITQFSDPNGTAEVTALSQNGYPAGEFVSVAINDNGRVVASYDNGQQVELAQVVTADFNAANQLKRLDGGIFAATSDSGEPILNSNGGVLGASLESSNTDISEEFTKLIVTQQAYAAGTRIVSTADQMLQEALNMIR